MRGRCALPGRVHLNIRTVCEVRDVVDSLCGWRGWLKIGEWREDELSVYPSVVLMVVEFPEISSCGCNYTYADVISVASGRLCVYIMQSYA